MAPITRLYNDNDGKLINSWLVDRLYANRFTILEKQFIGNNKWLPILVESARKIPFVVMIYQSIGI